MAGRHQPRRPASLWQSAARERRSILQNHTIFLLLIGVLSAGCNLSDLCGNSDVVRVPSPDERWEAWVFVRDCGATTGYSAQVSVLPASSAAPSGAGNALIIDERADITAEWSSPRLLTISCRSTGEVFEKEAQVGEVSIVYSER